MIQSVTHSYTDGHDTFVGKLVYDDAISAPTSGILIAPAFGGLGPFEEERAWELAAQGHIVLALDYYGDGKRAADAEEARALMGALNADRVVLARRMIAALDTLKQQEYVDGKRIGAMGYCFGGKAVLDLARTGATFQAAVAIHGVYDAPAHEAEQITPAVLILHGWDDDLSGLDEVAALTSELTAICEDWQMMAFGHTEHAFTNPAAQTRYSPRATKRAMRLLHDFFEETLGAPNETSEA